MKKTLLSVVMVILAGSGIVAMDASVQPAQQPISQQALAQLKTFVEGLRDRLQILDPAGTKIKSYIDVAAIVDAIKDAKTYDAALVTSLKQSFMNAVLTAIGKVDAAKEGDVLNLLNDIRVTSDAIVGHLLSGATVPTDLFGAPEAAQKAWQQLATTLKLQQAEQIGKDVKAAYEKLNNLALQAKN